MSMNVLQDKPLPIGNFVETLADMKLDLDVYVSTCQLAFRRDS